MYKRVSHSAESTRVARLRRLNVHTLDSRIVYGINKSRWGSRSRGLRRRLRRVRNYADFISELYVSRIPRVDSLSQLHRRCVLGCRKESLTRDSLLPQNRAQMGDFNAFGECSTEGFVFLGMDIVTVATSK